MIISHRLFVGVSVWWARPDQRSTARRPEIWDTLIC